MVHSRIDNKQSWLTIFFYDINDNSKYIVLQRGARAIEEIDMRRGYISKQELIDQYGEEIDIGTNSYIIEYVKTKGDPIEETLRLRVI